MDDDFTFGASVWATPDPVDEKPPAAAAESPIDKRKPPAPLTLDAQEDNFAHTDTGFDDFDDDDFGAPAEAVQFSEGKDDDFGDFEDFEEGEDNGGFAAPVSFQDVQFEDPFAAPGPSRFKPWQPLKLDPVPSYPDLQEEIYEILDPIWADEDISKVTTDDPIREVEGVGQILVTPSRCVAFALSTGLSLTLNVVGKCTKRSSIPHHHYDPPTGRVHGYDASTSSPSVSQSTSTKSSPKPMAAQCPHSKSVPAPCPRLQIGSRFRCRALGRITLRALVHHNHQGREATSSLSSGLNLNWTQRRSIGCWSLSQVRGLIRTFCLFSPDVVDYLAMQPLPNLERILSELKMQTANTSGLLTYLLQSREALQQDSETYNGLIANLVSEMAQKVKSGKPMGRSMSVRR